MSNTPPVALEDVRVVTNDVWTSFLASQEELEWSPVPLDGEEIMRASIDIKGDWSGTVTIEMLPGAAETAARTMLMMDEVEADDINDALGELVNMVGGNIKSLLPPGAALGLPQVTAIQPLSGLPVTEHCRVDLTWAGKPFRVVLWSADTKESDS